MTVETTKAVPNVDSIRTIKQWRAERASHLFETDSSFEWFIRKHRDRLIRKGAYLPRAGRSKALCTPRMDTEVAEILMGEGAA